MAVIEHGGDGAPERFAATRAPLERARHLPGYLYNAPDLYAAEKERIFLKDWLCVARVEEIERPGDFMTFRIMDEPIVVARNRGGELNAVRQCLRPSRRRGGGRVPATRPSSPAPITAGSTTLTGGSSAPPT